MKLYRTRYSAANVLDIYSEAETTSITVSPFACIALVSSQKSNSRGFGSHVQVFGSRSLYYYESY